jgi:hypothetical protein
MIQTDDVEVVEVKGAGDLNKFIKFPWKIYKGDPNWVPPLIIDRKDFFNKQKNPFYKVAETQLFLARHRGKVVGRIATCINRAHNEFHQEKLGSFGFFECIEDYAVAHKLLKVAMITLKAKGMEIMRGPLNFSTNHEIGLLIDGFDQPPVVMMTYNPPYYKDLLEKFGMKKGKDLLAYLIDGEQARNPRLERIVNRIRERAGMTVRKINVKDFDNEIQRVIKIYNEAWESNWGFVPLSNDEFTHIAKDMKMILDPDLALFGEIEGEPAGFALALPDVNQVFRKLNGRLLPFGIFKLLWNMKIRKNINQARVITLGVIKKYQKRGLDSVFYYDLLNNGVNNGYLVGELSWILEDNEMMRSAAEGIGARVYKTYRIYETPLMRG